MKLKVRPKGKRLNRQDEKPDIRITGKAKIAKEDWPLMTADPNPNFDPERNKRIIREVAINNWNNKRRIQKEWNDKLEERTDAAASYIKSLDNGKSWSVEEYFGKRELARLQGQEWIERMKEYQAIFTGNAKKEKKGEEEANHKVEL